MNNLSRREFFKKFISKSEKPSVDISLPETADKIAEQPILSRRSFIKFLLAMVAAVALEQVGVNTAKAQENKNITQESKGRIDQKPKAENFSINATERETEKKEKNIHTRKLRLNKV